MARRIIRVGRGSRPLKTWLGQTAPAFGIDVTSASSGGFSAGLKVFGGPNDTDATVLRTRGQLQAVSELHAEGPKALSIALGIGLCTNEAALAGAVPLPYDNPEWDGWFVYQTTPFKIIFPATGSQQMLEASMEVDSKAMRKIPSGQVLFLSTQMFSGQTSVGSHNVDEVIQIRALLKTS